MHFTTYALCNMCTVQHMHFATYSLCNMCTLQHVQFAACALCNMCPLHHVPFVTCALCILYRLICIEPARQISKINRLNVSARQTNWMDQFSTFEALASLHITLHFELGLTTALLAG